MEKPDTIKSGLQIMTHEPDAGVSIARLQLQELGLSVVLLGLAEKQAHRIKTISEAMGILEKDLFDSAVLTALTDSEKAERYNLAQNALNQATNLVKNSVNVIDWTQMEIRLRQLQNVATADNADSPEAAVEKTKLGNIAADLLSQIGRSTKQ